MLKTLLFLILLCATFTISAQSVLQGVGVEPNGYLGKLARHSGTMLAPVDGFARGGSLNLVYQTNGKYAWERFYKFPSIGVNFTFKDYDNNPYYGDAYSASFYIERYFKIRKNHKAYLRTTLGATYLTKSYDFYTNPLQTAIGSHWNANFSLLLGYQWLLNEHWQLSTGGGIIHASNGGATSQNLGLNVLGVHIGLKYTPIPYATDDFNTSSDFGTINKNYEIDAELNIGLEEQEGVLGGAFYPIYNYSLGVRRGINRRYSWMAGAEYEYNVRVRDFMEHIQRFEPEERFWQSSRVGLFVGTEIWYDRMSIVIKMGGFLTNNYKQKLPVFNKYGVRYYFIKNEKIKTYLGVNLKTQLIEAEYMSCSMGVRF